MQSELNILLGKFTTVLLSDDQDNLTNVCLLLKMVNPFNKVTVMMHQPIKKQPRSGLVKHIDMDFQTLSTMTFVYPRNFSELCQYLAALGASTQARHQPDVIAIVDCESFLEKDTFKSILQKTKILTLLRDSACKMKKTKCIITMKDAAADNDKENFATKLHFFADQVLNVKSDENSISISFLVSDKRLHYDFDVDNNVSSIVLKRIWQEKYVSLPDL